MKSEINFGIGFISGRPNVCKIINSYEKFIIEQLEKLPIQVNITVYVLYDLNYQHTIRTDFYGILPEAYRNLRIKYITPENIMEYEKILISRFGMTKEDAKLFIGNGYAKARNAILYCAMQHNMDYIMFWDDDEYPIANVIRNNQIQWIKQKNVLEHINNIDEAEVTMGYRCGMMNPIPYIEYTDNIKEEDYKNFIDALENEVISWEKLQTIRENTSCIAYADADIATGKKGREYLKNIGKDSFILGSGICLNLNKLNKIPAFYNPPNARGEDTFFSCALGEKKSKVLRIPTYHFHDSFLQFTGIMKEKYPKRLLKDSLVSTEIEQRFLKATIGWVRYKPLLYYIKDRKNYDKIIEESRDKLKKSVKKINAEFISCDFSSLIRELNKYDKDVEKHYQEYLRVNEIWDKFKNNIREG